MEEKMTEKTQSYEAAPMSKVGYAKRAITCLAAQVPSEVYDDVKAKMDDVFLHLEATHRRVREYQNALCEVDRILNSTELLEALADVEHERWSGWERYRETVACDEREGHWKRLRETPYSKLPAHSKESDRVEVRKTLAVIQHFLGKTGL
jgi:hypothetical protein